MDQPLNVGSVAHNDVNSTTKEEQASNNPSIVPNELRKESDFVGNSSEDLGLKFSAVSESNTSSDFNVQSKHPKESDETFPAHTLEGNSQQPSYVPNELSTSSHVSEDHAEPSSSENACASGGDNHQVSSKSEPEAPEYKFPKVDDNTCDVYMCGFPVPSKGKLSKESENTDDLSECLIKRFNAMFFSSDESKSSDDKKTKKRKRDEMQNDDADEDDDDSGYYIPFISVFDVPTAEEIVAEIINDPSEMENLNQEVIKSITYETELHLHKIMKDLVIEKQVELLEKHKQLKASCKSSPSSSAENCNLLAENSSNNDAVVIDVFAIAEKFPDLVPLDEIRDLALQFLFDRLTDAAEDIFC